MHAYDQRREHRVFQALLQIVPGLEKRLMEGCDDEVIRIAEMVRAVIPHKLSIHFFCEASKGRVQCKV